MILTYTPSGSTSSQEFTVKPEKLLSPEAEAIEKVTGMSFGRWQEQLMEGSHRAIRALLWVMLKRQTPTLRLDQVVISQEEVDLDMDADEKAAMLERIQARLDAGVVLSPDEAAALDELRAELTPDAPEAEPDVEVDAPDLGYDESAEGGSGKALNPTSI